MMAQQNATQPPRAAGAKQSGSFSAYAPGQAQSQQSPYASSSQYGQFNAGNYANMSPAQRPPAFEQSQQTPWGQMSPSAYSQQQAAFVSGVNNQMGQYMGSAGVYQGQGAPPSSWGQAPQWNPNQLWSQAGSAVQQGWQNQLAPGSSNPYGPQGFGNDVHHMSGGPRAPGTAQDPGAAIRSLLQEYNIPQSVFDKIGSMLGLPPRPSDTADWSERVPGPRISDDSGFMAPGGPAGSGQEQPTVDQETERLKAQYKELRAQERASVDPEEKKAILSKMGALADSIQTLRGQPTAKEQREAEEKQLAAAKRHFENKRIQQAATQPSSTLGVLGAHIPNAALGPAMAGMMWERSGNGWVPAGTPGPAKPRGLRTTKWGSMTAEELAGTQSPFLGGKWPTSKKIS